MSKEKGTACVPLRVERIVVADAATITLKDRFTPVFQGVLHFVKELVGNCAVYYTVVVA